MRTLIWLLLLLLLLLASCHNRVRYPAEFPSSQVEERTTTYYLWGLVGHPIYELYLICPEGKVYEIHSRATVLQGALTVLSLGIYSPRTVTFTCSGNTRNPLEMVDPAELSMPQDSMDAMNEQTEPMRDRAMGVQDSLDLGPAQDSMDQAQDAMPSKGEVKSKTQNPIFEIH